MITVPDDAIVTFSERLLIKGKLVVHTSGSVAMKALSNKNRKGLKVEFNVIHFETKELAKKEAKQTEAARKLRYNWFENLRREKKLDLVAVGTHKSDETETMLINLIRGAGIRGLHGIIPNNNGVIRPLLSVAGVVNGLGQFK